MTNEYFKSFKIINYNNALAINITQRAAILNKIFGDNYSFYPYVVKNGMRADQVAEKYYGDSDFSWLVYFSNNIIDPYHQWTMDDETFKAHIIDKYGSIAEAQQTIKFYRVNWYEDNRVLTKQSYDALNAIEKKYWVPNFDVQNMPIQYIRKEFDYLAVAQDESGNITLSIDEAEEDYWTAVSAWDWEEEENAKKAHIRLLDSRLAVTASSNLRQIMAE